jgi:hypothetical protein
MQIRVKCTGDQEETVPSVFWLGERRVEVVEVIDRWPAPDRCYFKIKGDDGGLYILRQDLPGGEWDMTMFQRQGG